MTFELVFALIGAAGVSFLLSASVVPLTRTFVRWRLDRQARKRALADVMRSSMQVANDPQS